MKKLLCVLLVAVFAISLFSCADRDVKITGDGTEMPASSETETETDTSAPIDFTPVTETEESTSEAATSESAEPQTEQTEPVSQTEDQTSSPDTTPPAPVNPGSYSGDPLISRMTFLGDSTTYGLKYYGIVGDNQVWTPRSGTLALFAATTDYIVDPVTGGEYTVGDLCAMRHPDILVITLGVNGIAMLDEANFKMYYNSLIDTIKTASPSTKIALQTMFPLAASYNTATGINNEKIANGNLWIQQLAAERGIPFINSASVLTDGSGYRPEAWQNGDGLHMSVEGFGVVKNYIINNPCY